MKKTNDIRWETIYDSRVSLKKILGEYMPMSEHVHKPNPRLSNFVLIVSDIQYAMKELTPHGKNCVFYSCILGYTEPETSDKLGMTRKNVNLTLKKSLDDMIEKLNNRIVNDPDRNENLLIANSGGCVD